MPASSFGSYREPTPMYTMMVAERTCGMRLVTTRIPFGKHVFSYSMRLARFPYERSSRTASSVTRRRRSWSAASALSRMFVHRSPWKRCSSTTVPCGPAQAM